MDKLIITFFIISFVLIGSFLVNEAFAGGIKEQTPMPYMNYNLLLNTHQGHVYLDSDDFWIHISLQSQQNYTNMWGTKYSKFIPLAGANVTVEIIGESYKRTIIDTTRYDGKVSLGIDDLWRFPVKQFYTTVTTVQYLDKEIIKTDKFYLEEKDPWHIRGTPY